MAFGLVLILHILVAFFLIGVILIQGGRGGLGEALGGSGSSSLFGGGGNVVMTKVTGVGASLFVVTCLLLAKLSTERGRSVIEQIPVTLPDFVASTADPLPDAVGSEPAQTGAGPESAAPADEAPVWPPASPSGTSGSPE